MSGFAVSVDTGWNRKKLLPGIVAEKLEGWNENNEFFTEIPDELRQMLVDKDAMGLYDEFVNEIAKTKRKSFGGFKVRRCVEVKDNFVPKFEEKGIKIWICAHNQHYQGGYKTHKWVEYVNMAMNPDYVPREHADDGVKACTIQ